MIISKPKPNALLAMGVFIILMLSLGLYALQSLLDGGSAWYQYVVVVTALPLGLILLLRQLLSYKVVYVGDNKVIAKFPFKGSKKESLLKNITYWKEEVIKTRSAPFRQLELKFESYTLKLTIQENTYYEQILTYLRRKATKKEAK